jgi:Type I restriction enzyme R protein N terminus (HSDR_N)
MVQTAVTKVIQTLGDVHDRLGLSRSPAADFFLEWQQDLPEVDAAARVMLDRTRQRFRYHREAGQVTEGMVNAIVVSPLLEIAGFYDPPFRLRAEQSIELETVQADDLRSVANHRVLRGRIDFLVMQEGFWQVVIESKETTFDIEVGIPQLLTYMMAAPSQQTALFGMVTNGSSFVFVKLDRAQAQYDFSDVYTMLSRANPLYPVVQILQGLARRMTQRIV